MKRGPWDAHVCFRWMTVRYCWTRKHILEPRYEVVGTVRDGRALLEAAYKLQPDVVVVDIGMPQLNELDVARQLKRSVPKAKLVFMAMNEDPDIVGEAFRAGGCLWTCQSTRTVN
jgi:DNA-binding NarL/FixJ family response regulator